MLALLGGNEGLLDDGLWIRWLFRYYALFAENVVPEKCLEGDHGVKAGKRTILYRH